MIRRVVGLLMVMISLVLFAVAGLSFWGVFGSGRTADDVRKVGRTAYIFGIGSRETGEAIQKLVKGLAN